MDDKARKGTPQEEEITTFKVLVVDDSDFSRSTIVKMLNNSQFDVVAEADSAKTALEVLSGRPVDIAIIDVVMPGISGVELAEAINSNFTDIEMIIISSLAHENIIIESINNGAGDFIQKPFSRVDLLNSLEKIANVIRERS